MDRRFRKSLQPVLPSRASWATKARPRPVAKQDDDHLVFYHHSGYKYFEYYCERCVLKDLIGHFPQSPSYTRFVQLIPRSMRLSYWMAKVRGLMAQAAGLYFVDSKKLPVCDNRRIHSHKVFEDIAQRGKTSTGWFFGLKIHLIVNDLGEIVSFSITAANVADNNKKVLDKLFEPIRGKCFRDKAVHCPGPQGHEKQAHGLLR